MRILSIDPSTRCTGWAVLDGLAPCDLVDGGLIKPSTSKRVDKDSPEHETPDLASWYAAPELAAARRVIETLGDLSYLLDEFDPKRIVVEIPSGKAGSASKRGAKGSLTTYGMGAGAVWADLRARRPGQVVGITERMWTAGAGNKMKRARSVEYTYPGIYRAELDKGMDLADAIGLGRWYLNRMSP